MSVGYTSGNSVSHIRGVKKIIGERWFPYFCIYKQKALECKVSHLPCDKAIQGLEIPVFYDVSALFQKALKDEYGFEIRALKKDVGKKVGHYIHYCGVGYRTLGSTQLYRWLRIASYRGLFGRGKVIKQVADYLLRTYFKSK